MKRVLLLLLILLFTCFCIAQGTHLKELHFNHLSIKNGLPEDVITTSLQDKEGYIWIGTQAGLVRYDGYTTKVYKFGLADPNRYTISVIYEDRTGGLWIGTLYEGLYHYNRATDTFLSCMQNSGEVNAVYTDGISAIHDDRNGNLWLLVSDFDIGKRVLFFDTKKNQFKRFGNSEKGHQYIGASGYNSLFEDSKGRIWVGTNNGIYEYSPSDDTFISHFASADRSRQKRFDQLTEDASHPGTIWMNVWNPERTKGDGLLRYNTTTNTVKTYHHIPGDSTSLGSDNISRIQKDKRGNLWFGTFTGLTFFESSSERFINYSEKEKQSNTYNYSILELIEDKESNFWCRVANGLLLFDIKTKTFTRYKSNEKDPDDLPYNYILNLLIDRSGTLWVGTFFQGIYWLNNNRSKFMVYKNNPGQPHYFPGGGNTSFAEDKDGTFWVWSSHGLYHWYPSTDSFASVSSLKDQGADFGFHFSSVLIDKKGIVWCSSYGKGLFSYNPATREVKNFKTNKEHYTSSGDYIATLYEDHNGTLLIGTMGSGLRSFNRETNTFNQFPFTGYRPETSNNKALNDELVYAIYEDKQQQLWLGTNLGGVSRFNREPVTFTPFQNQLPGFATVSGIFEDSKEHLWAGTHVGGIYLCDRKNNTAKRFTEKDGLLYDGVLGINEDNANNLWIASQRGFSILDIQTNKISRLSTTSGLPEEPENNLNFFKATDGRFLVPCNNGFISFYPEQLKTDTIVPFIHIESVEITNLQKGSNIQRDSIIYGYNKNEINLRYNENRITFNYVGLQYQNSPLNQYAYKLDGYDKDWTQAGTQRKVTYTNLSPNTYIFRVKTANSDGVWNEKEETLIVIISPPWWLTRWAYFLYAVVFTGAVWAFIAYRSKKLKRENVILEEKITHRTSQLKQSLEDLKSTQTQLIQKEKMASLGELTAGIAHEIQNPLNFVNNFSEVSRELIDELKSQKEKLKTEEQDEILNDIDTNLEKISHHGKRADAIVKGMLQHSQTSIGQKELTDINKLADEYLRLAYHGLRAKDKSFNAAIKTDFDETIGNINIIPQDIGRVVLNLINNAFYAVDEMKKKDPKGYDPAVSVSTNKLNGKVEIKVSDNGNGIPQKIIDKIFQPFFTTKPAGQGTGLGLSLAYDIIKAHGGEIKVQTKEGNGTEFIIQLPAT